MYKLLAKLKESGELCEIYGNYRSGAGFAVGVVLDYDDEFIVFWSLTRLGESNGLRVVAVDDVYMVQTGTRYLDNIKILSLQQKTREETLDFGGGDILHGALEYARDNNKMCTVELCFDGSADVCGKIVSAAEGSVEIAVVDQYGKGDGTAYVLEDDISALSIESRSELALKRLKLR